MKEYKVIETTGSSIAAGGSADGSVDMENAGRNLTYAITIKGDISSADVDVDVQIPGDTEQYDTSIDGGGALGGLDLTDGGEILGERDQDGLFVLDTAETVHVTVTNNDATNGDATVKILQYEDMG